MLNQKKIAKRIVEFRQKNGVSQEEFANQIGISRSSVGMYESGMRIPSDETKIKIADYFGVTVADIFYS